MSNDLWMGAFIGGVIVLGLILLIVGRANSAATKKASDIVDANQRAHDLLEERNQIGREMNHLMLNIAIMLGEIKKRGDDRTLRDWFAGMAMQGILAAQIEEGAFEYDETFNAPHQDWVPRTAYFMAEAMLSAREINPTV